MMTFTEFLRKDERCQDINDRRQSWRHKFDDWDLSLRRAFAVLIYCAQHDAKISYAALGRLSQIPDGYTRGHSIGIVIGAMLECIGRYCIYELKDAPHLTALCVNYISGFPSAGYWDVFNPDNADKTLGEQKKILSAIYKQLKRYDWGPISKELGVDLNQDSLEAEVFNQDKFYIPNSKADEDEYISKVTEEAKDNPDKADEVTSAAWDAQKQWQREADLRTERMRNDIMDKKAEGCYIRWFVAVWSCAVLVILCADYFIYKVKIPDMVYITLFGTTLIQVLGLKYLVVSHFFPKTDKESV